MSRLCDPSGYRASNKVETTADVGRKRTVWFGGLVMESGRSFALMYHLQRIAPEPNCYKSTTVFRWPAGERRFSMGSGVKLKAAPYLSRA